MKKRFLSMLLAAAMVAGLLPQIAITAKAAGGHQDVRRCGCGDDLGRQSG